MPYRIAFLTDIHGNLHGLEAVLREVRQAAPDLVLVGGDLSITGLGTVTYNDGKRVLGFGHSFFNLGPVDMPMSGGEVLMVLSSQFQPNKFANATEIAGALHQDRHSGIMG